MNKNDHIIKILEKMFLTEATFFKVHIHTDVSRGETWHEIKHRTFDSLEDAFWLANKVKLFEYQDYKGFTGKWVLGMFNGNYVVTFLSYESTLESLINTKGSDFYWLGKTPQEAVVNAIIAIYGDKP